MVFTIKFTSQFKKDLKLAKKQHKDIDHLFRIIEYLRNGQLLPFQYRDHILQGKYKGLHECHIEPDWILIYEYVYDVLILSLHRILVIQI